MGIVAGYDLSTHIYFFFLGEKCCEFFLPSVSSAAVL